MSAPKENGCICQTCAERGEECAFVAAPGEDECHDCRDGLHVNVRRVVNALRQLRAIAKDVAGER